MFALQQEESLLVGCQYCWVFEHGHQWSLKGHPLQYHVVPWFAKLCKSRSKTMPRWSEGAVLFKPSVDMEVGCMLKVSIWPISRWGVWVVEFGWLLQRVIKGSIRSLRALSHYIEKGLILEEDQHSEGVWLASSIRTMAWFSFCRERMRVSNRCIACFLGQYFLSGMHFWRRHCCL